MCAVGETCVQRIWMDRWRLRYTPRLKLHWISISGTLLLLGRVRVEIQWIIFWSGARGSVKRVYCHHNLASGGRCEVLWGRWGDHQDCSNKGRILPTTSYINTKYKCKYKYKYKKYKRRAASVRERIVLTTHYINITLKCKIAFMSTLSTPQCKHRKH